MIALQKLFYKNGDAISGRGWDDTRLQKPDRRLLSRHRHEFRYTVWLRIQRFTISFTPGENLQGKALQDFVIDKIDDLKGQDIIAIDVKGKSSITDCMIICTGTSTRHVVSIADHVVQESRAAGLLPLGVEGEATADWVVVDLGDVIVHVMQEESRRLYELEKLWG